MKLKTRELVLCALFTALVAIGAFLKIPIPPISFTLQFLFTNLAALLLGKKLGAVSIGVYVIIGLSGAPIFTQGGGISYIFQPSFGYLLGFIAGAYLAGFIVEKARQKSILLYCFAGFMNMIVVFATGVVYLFCIKNFYLDSSMSAWSALLYGALIFLPGDVLCAILSAFIAKRLIPIFKRENK